MKTIITRIAIIMIVVAMMLSTTSFAAMDSSLYLQYYNAYILMDGGTVTIYYQVQGTSIMDAVGVTEIYLYEKASNSNNWVPVETYLSTDSTYYSSMIGTHTTAKIDNLSYSGVSSSQYMAYVTVYAEKNGGSDSRNLIIYS